MKDQKKTEKPRASVEDIESMETQNGRDALPVANGRLHRADRAGLGDNGWGETPNDLIGDLNESTLDSELYDPLEAPSQRDLRRAMAGVIRRAQIDTEHR